MNHDLGLLAMRSYYQETVSNGSRQTVVLIVLIVLKTVSQFLKKRMYHVTLEKVLSFKLIIICTVQRTHVNVLFHYIVRFL